MSTSAPEMEATSAEDSGWVFLTDVQPLFAAGTPTEITRQGRGRDRLYLIPSGRLTAVGRDTVPLPNLDDLF